jgi:peptide/nickel transport system substrate-binding protein
MGKLAAVVLVGLMCGMAFASLAQAQTPEYLKGPYVDKIFWEVRTSEETALGDIAAGKADAFMWTTKGSVLASLPPDERDKIQTVMTLASYDEIEFNPVHNEDSPYLVTTVGSSTTWHREGTFFNPFAIKEIRYAVQFLINRQKVVDEILGGYGGSMFCAVKDSEASYEPYFKSVVESHGLTPAGDETGAIATINAEMAKAALALAGSGHTLAKGTDGFWKFDGEDLYLPALIRTEDERKEIGIYVCQQLEKAGLKMEQHVVPRSTTSPIVWSSDPKSFDFAFYTGGWLSMYAWKYPDGSIAQMYAPWYGYMPGGGDATFWNYQNDGLDTITKKAVTGQLETSEAYWDYNKMAIDEGINESVRIFVVYLTAYYAVNDRVSNIIPDREAGLATRWSIINMKTPDNVLRLVQFSSAGTLFMSTFEPVEGLTDVYTNYIWRVVTDYGMFASPDGVPTVVSTPYNLTKDYHFEDEDLIGDMSVPSAAMKYNTTANTWDSVGSDKKCTTKIVYDIKSGNWHDQQPVKMADVLYSLGFAWEWSSQDGDADTYYDDGFGLNAAETMNKIVGVEVVSDEKIAFYVNYIFPADDAVVADFFKQVLQSVSFACPALPWEVLDTMAELVAGGEYIFQEDGGISMLTTDHVADIRAKMVALRDSGYVPKPLIGKITTDEAKARYDAVIKWIDDRGHACISNGPFYVYSYNPQNQFLELRKFTAEQPPSPTPPGFIPGFTSIAVFAMVAIAVLVFRKKK